MICVGVKKLVPNVWLYPVGTLLFSELYRSTATLVRARPKVSTLANRRSSRLIRSPYSEPGSARLIETFAALPARLRPSEGATAALDALKLADSCAPGEFWNVALSSTSRRGSVYAARPLNCDMPQKGSSTRHFDNGAAT